MGGGINAQSKLAFSNMNRDWRLGLSPTSSCAGVATGLLKYQKHSPKKAKMTQSPRYMSPKWHMTITKIQTGVWERRSLVWIASVEVCRHGCRKDYSWEGGKSGAIWFFPLKTKKTTFFAENFNYWFYLNLPRVCVRTHVCYAMISSSVIT